MKDFVITIVLFVIMVLNFVDVLTDIELGVPTWHIIEESLIVLASGITVIFLIFDMRRRSAALKDLKTTLLHADEHLAALTDEMKNARRVYGEVIQEQFNKWGLTGGEQQVAMLLLKGLSFKEISSLRLTKEKTVRQQASNVYSKSGLEGRHALSAWFLEDFLAPS